MAAKTSIKPTARKLRGDEDFDGLDRVVASLPANWYYDPDWYQNELERIFYRNWIYLCHASRLAETRAFQRCRIGTEEIVVLRDGEGVLRGFHNSCRHRGSILCQPDSGRLRSKLLVCPYHQWSYALDGELVATSSIREAPDFDRKDFPLYSVAVQEWRGGIFVSLLEDPPDLASGFERGSDRIDHWPMESLVVGHRWRKVMQCNWKVFWENFNECLHCPNIHPELCELVPIYGRRISGVRDAPNWQEYGDNDDPEYAGGLRAGASSWSRSGQASGPAFPELTPAEIARGQSYFVSLPSLFIACHVDYMRTVRILPGGPEQTEIEVEWLFQPQTLARDDFDMEDVTEFSIQVMQQDAEASEMNQQGLHTRRFEQGVLMPEEHYVKRFQDWVRAQTES